MSINSKCPCGSGLKYKRCCKLYHDGKIPKNALELMKSRYSAYAKKQTKYIVKTSYNDKDIDSIKSFSNNSYFEKLYIIEFIDGENEAFVTFRATIFTKQKEDISFTEKSRFIKKDRFWLYVDGITI